MYKGKIIKITFIEKKGFKKKCLYKKILLFILSLNLQSEKIIIFGYVFHFVYVEEILVSFIGKTNTV